MRRYSAGAGLSPALSRMCAGKRALVTAVTVRLRRRRVGDDRVSDEAHGTVLTGIPYCHRFQTCLLPAPTRSSELHST